MQEQQELNLAEQQFDPVDIEKNKVVAALSYLGILFFLPLVVCPESRFGRFHANQGLLLLIVSIIINVVWSMFILIPLVRTLISLLYLAVFALFLYGLINTLQGNAKELPIIGSIRIIK